MMTLKERKEMDDAFKKIPRNLKARNVAGCLYEVIFDEKKVCLWSFIASQSCDACKERAEEETGFSAYSFRSNGYAILHQIKHYKKISYVVASHLRTFDEIALLFFAPNVQAVCYTSSSVSISKHSCCMVDIL